jgi:hypothetical protein
MSTISSSTTSTTAYKVTADTTGTLVLQTGATPTTALTISTAQVATLVNDAVVNGLTVGRGGGAQSGNTALGASALVTNSAGVSCTAIGFNAAYSNTASSVTAIGSNALKFSTVGNNTAVGASAGINTTTGFVCAIGAGALGSNTTGTANTAVGSTGTGYTATQNVNTTGSYNTSIGEGSLANNTVSYNTALGAIALYSNSTGVGNTATGYNAGYSTTGGYNTFIGYSSGSGVTSGGKNVILGAYTGAAAPISATASNHIVFSDGDGTVRGYFNNSGSGFFSGATVVYPGSGNTNTGIFLEGNGQLCVSRDNTVAGRFNRNSTDGTLISCARQGTEVGTIGVTTSATSYNTSSDYRLKNTIAPMAGALAKVAALKPVTYKWNVDGSDGEGFIAHELAEVCPNAVTGEKDAVETYLDIEGNEQTRPKYQGIDTSFLVATLTAAIQELKAEVDSLKAQLNGA